MSDDDGNGEVGDTNDRSSRFGRGIVKLRQGTNLLRSWPFPTFPKQIWDSFDGKTRSLIGLAMITLVFAVFSIIWLKITGDAPDLMNIVPILFFGLAFVLVAICAVRILIKRDDN